MAKNAAQLPDWDYLRIVLAVARLGSLSAAADALGTDQSTITRRLRAFEEQLGATLVERSTKGCRLTNLGERVRIQAEHAESAYLQTIDDAMKDRHEVAGKVRLAMTEGIAIHFFVPKVLPRILNDFPSLHIEILASSEPANLALHEADLALRFFRNRDGDLVAKKIASINLEVLAHRDLAKRLKGKHVSELPWTGATLHDEEGRWMTRIGVRHLVLQSADYEVQLAAIRSGVAVGLAAAQLTRHYSELVALGAPLPSGPRLELFLVTRAAIRKSARIAALWGLLAQEFARVTDLPALRKGVVHQD